MKISANAKINYINNLNKKIKKHQTQTKITEYFAPRQKESLNKYFDKNDNNLRYFNKRNVITFDENLNILIENTESDSLSRVSV
ncbi:MAG TPA: hypothetical protein PKD00_04100 [Burkholderiales bacterium]|nr:hypothetical protein [Burkholderiales bacterium]